MAPALRPRLIFWLLGEDQRGLWVKVVAPGVGRAAAACLRDRGPGRVPRPPQQVLWEMPSLLRARTSPVGPLHSSLWWG